MIFFFQFFCLPNMAEKTPSPAATDYAWYEGWDSTYKTYYYFNTQTESSVWEKPAEPYRPYDPDDDEEEEEGSCLSGSEADGLDAGDGAGEDESGGGIGENGSTGSSENSGTVEPKVLRYDKSSLLSSKSPSPSKRSPSKTMFKLCSPTTPPPGKVPSANESGHVSENFDRTTRMRKSAGEEEALGKEAFGEEQEQKSSKRQAQRKQQKQPKLTKKGGSKATNKPWNYANHGPPPLRGGQSRLDVNSVHAQQAAAESERLASQVTGDFISRQMADVKHREREYARKIQRERERMKDERDDALKLNCVTKRLLREKGMMQVDKKVWFERLHKSRINKMAQFLMGQREVGWRALDKRGGDHHVPTLYTRKEDRAKLKEKENTPRMKVMVDGNGRQRTNAATEALNPRRFNYLTNDKSATSDAIADDYLLSPQNKAGRAAGTFFKSNDVGDSRTTNIKRTSSESVTVEEKMFMDAFERNLRGEEERAFKEKVERHEKVINEQMNSVIGVALGQRGNDVSAATFFNPVLAEKFMSNAEKEEKEGMGVGGTVLNLSPNKAKARRASTSHLLVNSICKHINSTFSAINPDSNFLSFQEFGMLLEQMAFLRTREEYDQRLLQKLWNLYRDDQRNMVSLESCQRLLLQVLASLEIQDSLGGSAKDVDEERKLTAAFGSMYSERRLCQKPRHQMQEMQNGLLYNKEEASCHRAVGGISLVSAKKQKLKEAGGPHQPSPAILQSTKSLHGRTRRRASTFTTRLRKKNSAGGKKALEEHYACTFKPQINDYSKKLDSRANKKSFSRGSDGGGGRKPSRAILEHQKSEKILLKDSFEDAVHFLDKIIENSGGNKGGSVDLALKDIDHAFEALKNEANHCQEAIKAEEMLMESFDELNALNADTVDARALKNCLMDKFEEMVFSNDNFESEGEGKEVNENIPLSLKNRLAKWERWRIRRKRNITAQRTMKAKQEMKGCTFKPKLNKTTKMIIEQKKVGVRGLHQELITASSSSLFLSSSSLSLVRFLTLSALYWHCTSRFNKLTQGQEGEQGNRTERLYKEGLKRELLKRQKSAKREAARGKQMVESEEREIKEFCTFKPEIPKMENRASGGNEGAEPVLEEITGMKEWMFWNEMGKMKKQDDKARKDAMKLRKSGQHLHECWDPTTKFCKPFKFHGMNNRRLDERKFEKTNRMKASAENRRRKDEEHREKLKEKCAKVANEAKIEDLLVRRLNKHVGPPLFVLEVTTAEGGEEALYVWENEDLEALSIEYARLRDLSDLGRVELLGAITQNYNAIMEEKGKEAVDEDDKAVVSDECEDDAQEGRDEPADSVDRGELKIEEL